jgi:SAM-dependent methyltransferase
VDVTWCLSPYQRRFVRRPVWLRLTDHTYPPADCPECSWIPIAFQAFSRIARTVPVRDMLTVGTGNGLDALGALEIFNLASITLTDLLPEVVAVARENVIANLENSTVAPMIRSHVGDLLDGLPVGPQFCLVYENLPSVPAPPEVSLNKGVYAASFFVPVAGVPERFERRLLGLHYRCLTQARSRLRPGGGVLTSIGGRFPRELVMDLHRACGYEPRLVVFDIKLQTEPEVVLPAFKRAESEYGIDFCFYAPNALDLVAEARLSGLEGEELAITIEPALAGLAMSARDALRCHLGGQMVAHSVLMVFGELQDTDDGG